MRDEQHGHAEPLLEIVEQFKNLRLRRHVEGGCRFIGDEEGRVAGKRHRNHDTLPHAAGQAMRIFLNLPMRIRNAHQIEKIDGSPLGVGARD